MDLIHEFIIFEIHDGQLWKHLMEAANGDTLCPIVCKYLLSKRNRQKNKRTRGEIWREKNQHLYSSNIYGQFNQSISRHHQRTSYRVNYLTRAPLNIFGTKSHANQPEISLSYWCSLAPTCHVSCVFFKESALGRFFHRVAMCVYMFICPLFM